MNLDASRPTALTAAALLALDPQALGGVRLKSAAGPRRDAWLAALRALLPPAMPWLRLPVNIADERLLGGLDLTATLASGRPVAQRGVLAQAHGGIVVAAMAERMTAGLAARLGLVLDSAEVQTQRDGLVFNSAARIAVVALDEGIDDESLPASLADRLGLHVDLDASAPDGVTLPSFEEAASARARLPSVRCDDAVLEALVTAAAALGVMSARAPWFALVAARAAAAWAGRDQVSAEDAAVAVQWVLAPRATQWPAAKSEPEASQADASDPEAAPPEDPGETPENLPEPQAGSDATSESEQAQAASDAALGDQLIAAAQAAIPAGLLALLQSGGAAHRRSNSAGRAGAMAASKLRGRPVGAHRGEPRGGSRLSLIETLRAAAPWQRARRASRQHAAGPDALPTRVLVHRDDLHVMRYQQRRSTTTLFVLDASGSAALHRLAEAKGAVELLLSDCYARRDNVAVLGFRGAGAQVLLPPTRSLVRARRSLAGLPGGGGTPLAAGLDAARALAETVSRSGATALLVVLTDGRANISRDGQPGREQAQADALSAARALAQLGCAALLVDTSPQPAAAAQALAVAMNARYLALPYAAADVVSRAVKAQRR